MISRPPPLDWAALAPRYEALLAEPLAPDLVDGWLRRWSDLDQIVWEARAWLKRDRARDATDAAAQRAYAAFAQAVMGPFQAAGQRLRQKLLALPGYTPPPEQARMQALLRVEAGLYSAEALALNPALEEQEQRALTLLSGATVLLDGAEQTQAQADARLHDPDRVRREAAWRALEERMVGERPALADLLIALVGLRQRQARLAGLPDYRAYRWRALGRLDYTPEDCLALHAAVETELVPLAGRLLDARRRRLGLAALRPWDLEVDPDQPDGQSLFADAADLEEQTAQLLARIDPGLGALFERMRDGFLDLESRPGKAPGGEQWSFPQSGMPYIHMHAVGTADDLLTLLHECGHALHDALSAQSQPLLWNRGGPAEFEEFAAMGLVALALPHLERARGGPLDPEAARRARSAYLAGIAVRWLPMICMADAFQHWLYTEAPADLRPADLDAQWRALGRRFLPSVDWSGLEDAQGGGWWRQRLIFTAPFYAIEYVVAHLGALQLWRRAESDHTQTWRDYCAALALGNTRPLPELLAAAGVRTPFGREAVRLAAEVLGSEC